MTTNAERGLRPERAAEIIVGLPDGGRRGSGYLVTSGRVLTAAHVVEGAARVRVRFQADRPGELVTEATVAWAHAGIDIAVLTLPEGTFDDVTPVVFGRVGDEDAVLRCTALGFPRFKLRTDEDGSFRDAEHMHATCAVLSNRREGTLDLAITSPPADDADPERDAWEGMSGAAVFSDGRLVGVVTRHHRTDGPGRIAAIRVDRWAESLDGARLAGLERLMACDLHGSALPAAAPDIGPALIQEAYRAQLADIAPLRLEDREPQLRDLLAFCGGPDQYLWLQGPPWAGKTALAAWFAMHPPRGVVPVWFFITARYAGQSDGAAYTAAAIDQLATIAGRAPTGTSSPTARDGERRLLLRQAAERLERDGGTLLLVVDGLDEDQSLLPGGSGTSIASLLPERLPPNVRVLVASRTNPGLPSDVKGTHPLRHCPVMRLTATEGARHTEYEAKFDLHQALSGDRVQRDLVGLLTAARGTLTVDDLRELTGEPSYELRRRLGSAFGRILRERGGGADSGGDVTLYVAGRGYLFAHETLLTAAQEELGPDVDAYLERLHSWAEKYQRRGWPEDTPLYLLQPYGRLLAFLRDARRVVAFATDARRCDRLREVTGSDAACLSEITVARQIVRGTSGDDLGGAAALAAVADLVARRNESLHPDIPAVYARHGRTRQAIGLAHTVFRPMDRAKAMAGVAHVLAESGDRRAAELAEEAVRLTALAVADPYESYGDSYVLAAQGRLATVLARTGRGSEALQRLSELPLPGYDSGVAAVVEAFVATAAVLQDRERAADLLRQAEQAAETISFLTTRVRALASVAEVWDEGLDPGRAERLYDSIVMLAREHAGRPPNVPASAAEVLHRVRPREAEQMAELAVEHAHRIMEHPQAQSNAYETYGAVRALVAMGRVDDAHQLAEALWQVVLVERWGTLPEPWSALAEGRARQGRATEAWACLEAFWESDDEPVDEDDRSAARVAELLAAAGAADELESLLLNAPGPWQWAVAEALTALAAHFAVTEPDRSWRLLHQAERRYHSTGGSVYLARHERLAVFAGALATVGRSAEAERLVGSIARPEARAWGYAAVSLAAARDDIRRALRLAEQAVETACSIDHWLPRVNALTVAVQALAGAGAVDRTEEVIEQLADMSRDPVAAEVHRDRARAEAAAFLWPHAPEETGRLVDSLIQETHDGSVSGYARLFAAAGTHDSERGARVMKILHDMAAGSPRNVGYSQRALLGLLTGTADPAGARRHIDQVVSDHGTGPLSAPGNTVAIAYAALGDLAAAWSIARGRSTEEERSETFAALAAFVACVPGDLTATRLLSTRSPSLVRRLAAFLFPPESGPDLPTARALLAEALTPDGWHHAVPVLADIDPEAVLRVRDVVLAHLGFSSE
ncbi:trypsin-like peptidase domain-containing protein [Streptomyces aurantiogriseus]|uniref:NACHT domain-containing protein n=1 Tax=Streptomyces aurantiogriseus TaxID=66870 RepID=A0A918FIE3_9ACTN|nr:trypsin-like peptidase domain-containing protein [Streptomyces aurantiogriseus]GGR39929.1 hypothetical protein GCM10010251_65770 [Streptomyces aurantiogriseus]